jgi:hypothetical protein
VELTAALANAAAITQEREHHATVPQLSFADILAEARAKGRDLSGMSALPPEPIAEPVQPDAMDPAFAERETYAPALAQERVRLLKPKRRPARTLAMAFALLGTSAFAFAVHVREGRSSRSVAAYSGSLATAYAQPEPPRPSPPAPPPPEAASEPVVAAPVESPPVLREPTRSELAQAKRLVKRASRYVSEKRYATAALAYTKALALVPDHVKAMRALVRIHVRERNVEDALHWAEQLARLEPHNSMSQRLLDDARALSGASAQHD